MEGADWCRGDLRTSYRFVKSNKLNKINFIQLIILNILEHLITNLIPAVSGTVLMKSHVCTLWIWFSCVAITTITDHSGFHLPFLKSSEFHDYHHVTFSECYGTSGLMDFIFKTDLKFRQSINFKRHRVLLTLKSTIRSLYPKPETISKQLKNE